MSSVPRIKRLLPKPRSCEQASGCAQSCRSKARCWSLSDGSATLYFLQPAAFFDGSWLHRPSDAHTCIHASSKCFL